MTRTDEFIGQLEGYLDDYEGSTPLPEAVRDAIRAELPSTHQRPPWWPARRFPEMNNIMKLGLATAGVVVAALLGYNYFVAPNVGGPAPSDPAPTATPDASPPSPVEDGEALDPGTYTLALSSGTAATITVPDGWEGVGDFGAGKSSGEPSEAYVVFWPANDFTFAEIYTDPCAWSTDVVEPVGPTVDDLADALAAQAMRGDAVPTDVTVDGYEGRYLEMSVPTDIDFADCDGAEFRSWDGRFHQGPGQIDRLYILDVDGAREVLVVNHMPATSDADLSEQQAVFESIDIQP